MTPASTLEAVLADAQRWGMLGARPVSEVIEHARGFVVALNGTYGRVIDLGSGGGVPGLVVANDRPDLDVTLVDRRQKRTDFLERAVRRLGFYERCHVRCCDVMDLVRSQITPWDAVISRGFGPPDVAVRFARQLVTPQGLIVLSEPPPSQGDRWSPQRLSALAVERLDDNPPGVVMLRPVHEAGHRR